MPDPSPAVSLTWQPAESGITVIQSYSIFRAEDGGAQALLINCKVLRDFLGGIIGVEHCTTVPSIPSDDDSGSVYDKVTNEQAPVTYIDTTVAIGHQYCYQIQAIPLGNNQSVAQGPPSMSNVACTTAVLQAPTLAGSHDITGAGVVLQWSLPTGQYLNVTGWTVFKSIDGGAFAQLAAPGPSQLSLEDTAIAAGHTYAYYVTYAAAALTSPQSLTFTISL